MHRFLRVLLVAGISVALTGMADATSTQTSAPISSARALAADPMLVVDVGTLSLDEQLTFAALQGIVNRTTPTLYLIGLRNGQDFEIDPTAEDWLADAIDVPYERVSPDVALARLVGDTNGMVVWDPAVLYESQNVATTIAGRDDLLPVSPEMAIRFGADFGLVVEMDLRDLGLTTDRAFTEWAITQLEPPPGGWSFPVWTGRPRNGRAIQPGLRDWAVAHRAFVFDADPAAEAGLLGKVLDLFPRGTGVYGYLFFDTPVYQSIGLPVNEALGVGELTAHGDWLIPTTDSTNMTVHALSSAVPRRASWDDTVRTPDPTKTYVSFVVSDGDALGYDLTMARSLQFTHLGADSVPIGISTSPLLATHAPAIWNWYLDHLPANAKLVAGPSGSGYFYPSYASLADRARFFTQSRTALDATGLRSTWVINPILTPSPSTGDVRDLVAAYAPSSLYLDYQPVTPLSPTVSYTDGIPVTRVAFASNPGEIADAIRASRALQSNGPRFVSVGLVAWGTNADHAAAALQQFGDDVVAVAPDEYAGLLRGAAASGYTGSSDRPEVPTAPVGACRADVDQISWGTVPVAAAFLGNVLFGGDLLADAKATGPGNDLSITVDEGLLTGPLRDTLAALGPLAFSADAVAHSEVRVWVTDLGLAGPDGGATVAVSGRYHFAVTLDPGDGLRTASLSVPIRCTAVRSGNIPLVEPPTSIPVDAPPTSAPVVVRPTTTPVAVGPARVRQAEPAVAVVGNPSYTG